MRKILRELSYDIEIRRDNYKDRKECDELKRK